MNFNQNFIKLLEKLLTSNTIDISSTYDSSVEISSWIWCWRFLSLEDRDSTDKESSELIEPRQKKKNNFLLFGKIWELSTEF